MKRKTKAKAKAAKPNTLFPGKPNYVGPQRGWFGHIHHAKLAEHSSEEGINARVKYIRLYKPDDEKGIRLAHLIYLGPYLTRLLNKEVGSDPYTQLYNSDAEHTELRKKVLAYCRKHIRGYKWDETICNLRKANGTGMTG